MSSTHKHPCTSVLAQPSPLVFKPWGSTSPSTFLLYHSLVLSMQEFCLILGLDMV